MTVERGQASAPVQAVVRPARRRRYRWDALAAVLASLIGLLALGVSAWTAHIERQQVRAQVWAYLFVGYADPERSVVVLNKGVGPALIRSVRMLVDGKPQKDWKHLMAALAADAPEDFVQSTLNRNVIAPGEKLEVLHMPDFESWQRFRSQAGARLDMQVCYCSTLGDCWMNSDRSIGEESRLNAMESCPQLPAPEIFQE